MNGICFLFPGQGSQKVGMGQDLALNFKKAKDVFETASEIFNFNLLKKCTEASQEEINNPKISNAAIVATSIAAFEIVKESGIFPEFLAGHSLGQYASLYAAEVLNLEETFKIVKLRVKAFENTKQEKECGMCAIINAPLEEIEKACKNASSYVVCANHNTPTQTVISGELTAIKEVCEKLQQIAKRCVILNVPNAFHSELMLNAALVFKKSIETFNFKPPKTKIFSNITAKIIEKTENFKELLVKHITSPVLFKQTLQNLNKENVSTFLELGQGTTLSSFVNKTLENKNVLNVSNKESLTKTLNFFSRVSSNE